jgi:hypothetical protein
LTNSSHVTGRPGTFGPRIQAPAWTWVCDQFCNGLKLFEG